MRAVESPDPAAGLTVPAPATGAAGSSARGGDTESGRQGGPGGPRRPGRGDVAPDFDLEGTGARRYRLSEYAGQPVVVVFYPADHSPVCTLQLRSYSEDLDAFRALGAAVLCLSPQDTATHEDFARAQGVRVPLLSDPGAAVGETYGILGPLRFYRRSVFVVDAGGIVRFARRSLSSLTYVSAADLLAAVRSTSD